MSASRVSPEVAVAHSKQCGCPIATCLSRLHFHFGCPRATSIPQAAQLMPFNYQHAAWAAPSLRSPGLSISTQPRCVSLAPLTSEVIPSPFPPGCNSTCAKKKLRRLLSADGIDIDYSGCGRKLATMPVLLNSRVNQLFRRHIAHVFSCRLYYSVAGYQSDTSLYVHMHLCRCVSYPHLSTRRLSWRQTLRGLENCRYRLRPGEVTIV